MSGAAHARHRSRQDYATPREFLRAVEARFGPIGHDVCAAPETAVAPSYWTEADDALSQDWSARGGRWWCNPPFGHIAPWAERCASRSAGTTLLLVPASVGSEWYARWVHDRAAVLFLRPRLSFDGRNPYPKDCLLAVYGRGVGYETWRWDRSSK